MADVRLVVDISQLRSIADKTEMQIYLAASDAVRQTVVAIRDQWIQRAQTKLKSTLPDYLLGLDVSSIRYPYDGDTLTGAVELVGKWPNQLEQGFTAFDMKDNFAKSQRKKTTAKGGWYMAIPFRHGTPTSVMHGMKMTPEVYKKASKLPDGGRLPSAPGTTTSHTGYKHKNTFESGLTRIIKSYHNQNTGKTTKQSQYMTFRMVSNKSDPKSWWHPGFAGVNIVKTLEPYASQTFTECFYNHPAVN